MYKEWQNYTINSIFILSAKVSDLSTWFIYLHGFIYMYVCIYICAYVCIYTHTRWGATILRYRDDFKNTVIKWYAVLRIENINYNLST